MKRILFFVLITSSLTKIQAQCNPPQTITICDMTIIDGDSNGTPDGIINLYDEYNAVSGGPPISLAITGTWFDPNFSFALDETTGDLYLWDLSNASRTTTDYQFIINNASCGSGPAVTLNLILGPFSGDALPIINADDVNIEICDAGSTPINGCILMPDIDLFQALESVPSPHLNGTWVYNGSSPNFVSLVGSNLTVTIPYQQGPPLVDEETFEFTYTVIGMPPCNMPLAQTTVNVSIVRQVFSGFAQNKRICETDILNGNYDADIDLTDDQFLLLEDIEGVWSTDLFGEITSPVDSEINIRNIYQQIVAGNPKFGCREVDFTYSVDQRSGVCGDASSTISFKIYEYIRPFNQQTTTPFEFCEDAVSMPASVNLYDQLEFTTENGVLFDYNRSSCTDWNFISGPSDLGLVSNTSGDPCTPSLGYSSLGTVNLLNADPGIYVFEYVVHPEYNCYPDLFEVLNYNPNICAPSIDLSGFCNEERAQVTLTIHPKNYAGEDTSGLQFCETDPTIANPLDLFTLLTTNGIDDPIYQGSFGTWVDLSTGSIVANPVTLPNVNGQQTFNYLYSTTTLNNCVDRASLSFTVYEEYQSGISNTIDVCNTNAAFNLFDRLGGSPNTTGTWSGPNGFTTTDHNAMFDPMSSDAGDYTYTVPDNVDGTGVLMCSGNSATMTVVLHQSPSAGSDGLYSVCRSDSQIDLVNYLSATADSGGTFVDLDTTNALSGSLLDVSRLTAETYRFQYEIQGHASCSLSTAIISIMVVEVAVPTAINQTFCANQGATVSDLQASNGIDFNWYDTATSTNPLPLGTVLIDGEDYYVSALDSDNCESERVQITVAILPLNHADCEPCFKDGISVNGDGENDDFDLCGLPTVFPNFELNIYNRFGSIVYKGNKNTPLFKGISNVALTIGEELPSGVYFYVFDPKDGVTDPMQGNFYLSR
ncbi:gliding motility-associated C-terminal domain-containing protein [Flavivirga spongiicola]|uniref:Gliding motility-associated C-terminal domain-containing protein n=1 Tax=Flavivirga spongiicola TaxID=421621 RepID=A0ABU7XQM2_9FLAO|nr:gliding motility-associated C-terminal domain-containing protein [Flavivirga sp. MEBiC05379]MDO5978084.1 gliding motility-associated C-terminal domain-containing protein [Flavivirga sp. MEBiC05379]